MSSTNSKTFNCLNFNVALVTPSSSPWISYNIIFFTVFSSITHCNYCVINVCSTSWRIKYARCIMLPIAALCVDSDRYWPVGNGWFQFIHRVFFYRFIPRSKYHCQRRVVFARAVFSSVGIIFGFFCALLSKVIKY